MKIRVNNTTFEHDDPAVVYTAALTTGLTVAVWGENVQFEPPQLDQQRAWALSEIQRLRGELRCQYIPDIAGQEMVYTQKLLAAKNIVPRTALAAEAAERKLTVDQLAELVEQKNAEWLAASDQIEAVVYKARVSVENATTVEEIVSALVALAEMMEQK